MTTKPAFQVVRGGRSKGGLVQAMAAAPGERVIDVRSVAHSPLNPGSRIVDDAAMAELVTSVQAQGVIQPIVVFPAEAWRATYPEDAVAESAAWVVVMGNRRVHAAIAAGRYEVPAVVRDDPQAATLLMLVENLQRKDLDPLDEARGYARLVAEGLSYAQLATQVGKSKGHISKRLTLLKLGPRAQELVAAGTWRVSDVAERGAELTEQMAAEMESVLKAGKTSSGMWSVMDAARRRISSAECAARAQSIAHKIDAKVLPEGRRVGPDLVEVARVGHGKRQLDPEQLAAIQGLERLAVQVRGWDGSITVYARRGENTPLSPSQEYEQRAKAEEKARHEAGKARRQFLKEVFLKRKVSAAELRQALAEHIVGGVGSGYDAEHYLAKLIEVEEDAMDQWRTAQSGADAERAAYLITLGAKEATVSRSQYGSSFSARGRAYLTELVAAGYEPTEWELEHMKPQMETEQ